MGNNQNEVIKRWPTIFYFQQRALFPSLASSAMNERACLCAVFFKEEGYKLNVDVTLLCKAKVVRFSQ